MAPIGKIYTYPNNPRAFKALIAAKYNDLEIEVPAFAMGTENKSPEFLKKFPFGKVPAFEGTDGSLVVESNAIAYYVANYKDDTVLLGRNKKEAALIHQWIAFGVEGLVVHIGTWIRPLHGWAPFIKQQHDLAVTSLKANMEHLNKALLTRTYLVGESITLADIIVSMILLDAYKTIFDKEFRDQYKNVTRWFLTCVNQPNFKAVIGEVPLCEVQAKYVAPKKEEKKKEEKKKEEKKEKAKEEKKEKPKKKEEEDDDDDGIPRDEPKPKSKLELLPPSKLNLEEWKRFYSNNETADSVKWFWEHWDPEGYSIWKVDYKYNDELALIFMSSNLIGGFFNRLERARKYAFGSLVVRGENNKNSISGYFFIRGQEVPEEVTDAADYESFNFVKVEPADYEAKKGEIAEYLSWEMPGFADGKIFK